MQREIIDITKENLNQVPASRGSNKIEFIVVHYLGVPNADNPYLYGGGYGGHYNIKRDGSIYKAADPRTAVVWHCGGDLQGSGGHSFHRICTNYNSIGIECGVCYTENVKSASGDSDKWYFTTETQESLVFLVSKLMDEYGISIDHVIRHYDVTGKICPNPYVKNNRLMTSWTWDEFKAKLNSYRKDGNTMEYTNSSLVTYKCMSPNNSGYRGDQGITRITPHCVVGQCTVETLGNIFLPSSRQASSNYGIGYDGRIAMYVEEKNRSWCTGGDKNVNGRTGSQNDYHAVTIEVASDTTEPYAFKTAAYNALIDLCVDICKRNGKNKLIWINDAAKAEKYWDTMPKNEMLLTVHRWYASKSCPGNWMFSRMCELASKVTARLGGAASTPSTPSKPATNTDFPVVPFLVTVLIDDLNYRSEGSMSGTVKGQTGKGVFTIVEVKNGWGRLKSGVGWIYLGNASYCTIGKTVQTETPTPSVPSTPTTTGLQASELKNLSDADAIKKVGPLATADQKKSGILASVTLAQFILESGYGKSELAQNANNVFGMKKSLSGNTWEGSSWDGKSIYTKKTQEQNADGSYVTITADFRKYPCVEDSIADHSAYLNGAMNGSKKRYEGVKGCTDYKKAIQLIKDGGYATSLTYVEKLCEIVERWNLTQYDVKTETTTPVASNEDACREAVVKVMQSWLGKKESDGSFKSIIDVYNKGLAEAVKTHGTRNCKMDYSWAWCACASSAACMQAGMAKYYPIEISCYYIIEIAKKEGTWVEADNYVPKPADWILYDWDDSGSGDCQGSPDHVGVVEKCDGKTITVIEGNSSDMVKRRTISVNGRYIRGFVVPKFDGATPAPEPEPTPEPEVKYYRVRKSWSDSKSQVGAYKIYKNAVKKADAMGEEYAVYDWTGKEVYRPGKAFEPYLVRVSIDDLNIRKGPGTNYARTGSYTGKGVFTIVEESDGQGASKWGKLKSGAGWISLDYCTKV